jgi:hypothetical protein
MKVKLSEFGNGMQVQVSLTFKLAMSHKEMKQQAIWGGILML